MMQPAKEKKLYKKKNRTFNYAKMANHFYKIVCMQYQIDYKNYNPFKLKYLNCLKKTKKVQAYFNEINRIIVVVSYSLSRKAKSKKFKNFISNNMKMKPDESNQIIDTKSILRKLKFEAENEPSTKIKPKLKYYKPIKIPKFSQMNDIETSYYNSLFIT